MTPNTIGRDRPLVSIIMIFLDEERFIEEAIESVFAQTYSNWELILVDDGSRDRSTDSARDLAARHPSRVRYVEHPGHANRGMSASRNAGLLHASGEFLAFLDADDVYLPEKLERQLAAFDSHPRAGLVYAATQYWYSWEGNPDHRPDWTWSQFGVPANRLVEPPALLETFLSDGRTLPCPGSLLVRRDAVDSVGGFEDAFRGLFEDQVLLAKLALAVPALPMSACLDRYRQHSASTCAATTEAQTLQARDAYLRWLGEYLRREGIRDATIDPALSRARAAQRQAIPWRPPWLRRLTAGFKRWRGAHGPRLRRVRFGSLRRTTPISRSWGQDRGRALDRYYIERFLDENREDIRGRVLEIGDAHYTRRFGGARVASSDVLHVKEGNPQATIVADLTSAEHIPDSSFDCIILTQTLQLIFDVQAALRTVRRILKPGGVLLATFPGITHTGDPDWSEHWCWSFTRNSARRLFYPVFDESNVRIGSHGNVLAATAFLYGLADTELEPAELDVHDPAYPALRNIKKREVACHPHLHQVRPAPSGKGSGA